MGSGLGRDNVQRGDYDITLFDQEIVRQYGLDDLHLGDIFAGHGPGVTTLMTCPRGTIVPVDNPGGNIADLLRLR